MVPRVLAMRHGFEIVRAVVAAIMIPMMHDIVRRDRAEVVLINPTVEFIAMRVAVVAALAQLPDFAAVDDTPRMRTTVHGGLRHRDRLRGMP
jgi:hypothetical protein